MKIFNDHPQFAAVKEICRQLIGRGYKAYLAGGCVRDGLLGKKPHDFDIATDAPLSQLNQIFPHALEVGKQFGILILPFSNFQIEVATFRADGEYVDGRHPLFIHAADPMEDAKRRDFTINALFYDFLSGQILDFVDGRKDLNHRVLRTVGDPKKRFQEDKLRLLRALRIATQLDFSIERETWLSIGENSQQISIISRERIAAELRKVFLLPNKLRVFHEMAILGLNEILFSKLKYMTSPHFYHWQLQGRLFIQEMSSESRLSLIWAALFWPDMMLRQELKKAEKINESQSHFNWRREFEEIFKEFCLSREEKEEIIFVFNHLDEFLFLSDDRWDKKQQERKISKSIAKKLILLDHLYAPSLLRFAYHVSRLTRENEDNLFFYQNLFIDRCDQNFGKLPASLINGSDLIEMGYQANAYLGQILKEIYLQEVSGDIQTRQQALDFANKMKK